MDINEVFWHDGILNGIAIDSLGVVRINCELYMSSDSRMREKVGVVCTGVHDVTCSLDMTALLDNAFAGNIADGKVFVKPGRNASIKIFFADGYLAIHAHSLNIEKLATVTS